MNKKSDFISVFAMVGAALLLIATPEVFARSASMESVPDAKVLNYRPVRFGDYEVYYSAFKSTFIPPETAEMYSLMRGEKYGIINIAVRNIKDSETGKAVTSTVSGEQQNLMTQVKKLTFREVKEGSAIYYLADFKFSDEELLKFTIDVKPQGGQRAETIQFEQTFYE